MKVQYGDLREIQMQDDEIESVVNAIKAMPDDGIMVEWGSGGSTIHWLLNMREDQHLITIEHVPDWAKKIEDCIDKHYPELRNRFTMYLQEPITSYEHGYASINEEHPNGLDHYFDPDDIDMWDADVFLVDGIARAVTALVVRHKSTREDPVVFMHDFTGREHWYSWVLQFYSKWETAGYTLIRLWK